MLLLLCSFICLEAFSPVSAGQQAELFARVHLARYPKEKLSPSPAGAVLWLVPLDAPPPPGLLPPQSAPLRLLQVHKSFQPHLLVVRAGDSVAFPNHDPFFHNVFSLFNGKRFDLGLYEAGSSRRVVFDRPGICYIFCNIHPQMSAVIVVLDTPYYGISDSQGKFDIPGLPPGRYLFRIWQERAEPSSLASLRREILLVPGSNSLGTLALKETPLLSHRNMYGHSYETPSPPNPAYSQP